MNRIYPLVIIRIQIFPVHITLQWGNSTCPRTTYHCHILGKCLPAWLEGPVIVILYAPTISPSFVPTIACSFHC
jgi:hypothetical protein